MKQFRIACHLWGCWCSNEYPGCLRCGAALYDADFIQIGRMDWKEERNGFGFGASLDSKSYSPRKKIRPTRGRCIQKETK
jgi:hypothetical protein